MKMFEITLLFALAVAVGCQDTAGGGGGDDARADATSRPDSEPMPDAGPEPDGGAEPDASPPCADGDETPCMAGACAGIRICADGEFGDCRGPTESCNGLDDDCDGSADEDFGALGEACGAGEGRCAAEGVMACDASGVGVVCDAIPGMPSDEICDGIDDDCDGAVDESIAPTPCATDAPGVCAAGTTACVAGALDCLPDAAPSGEICDGLDNNCDGVIDDDAEGAGMACAAGIGGCQREGSTVCGPDGELACDARAGLPEDEICDAIDNDCDGIADEPGPAGDPCHQPACGDGMLDPGEACDDGNLIPTDACTDACQLAACGDGIVQAGVETCDDGNIVDGDGCSPLCQAPPTEPGCPAGLVTILGNPGFENGAFAPWQSDFAGVGLTDFARTGSAAAETDGNHHIEQIIDPPFPVADLVSARFWTHHDPNDAPAMSIEWTYGDGTQGRGRGRALGGWQQTDILPDLDPNKDLASIRVWGYSGGGAAPDIVRYDDFEFCAAP